MVIGSGVHIVGEAEISPAVIIASVTLQWSFVSRINSTKWSVTWASFYIKCLCVYIQWQEPQMNNV